MGKIESTQFIIKLRRTIIAVLTIIIICIGFYTLLRKTNHPGDHYESSISQFDQVNDGKSFQSGDLIFQTSLSEQSKAIQLATKSKYSHCGIIYQEGNDFHVFEAIQPVTRTPLEKWIARGDDSKYVVKRLKNAEQVLTPEILNKMRTIGEQYTNKDYDLHFEWTDNKIYCSELIWKIYQRATGIEIGKLQKLKDFDFSNEAVKKKLKERYGKQIPWDESVISPAVIFDSELLITVASN